MRTILSALAICLALLANVAAHSPVSSTTPAGGATLAAAPAVLVITFRSEVRITKVTVTSDAGDVINVDLSGKKSFATEHRLPAPDLASGKHQVEWRALAKDGHAMKGSFSFTIR